LFGVVEYGLGMGKAIYGIRGRWWISFFSFSATDDTKKTVVCLAGGRYGPRAAGEAGTTGGNGLIVDKDRNCLASRSVDAVIEVADSVLGAEQGKALFQVGDGTSVLLTWPYGALLRTLLRR